MRRARTGRRTGAAAVVAAVLLLGGCGIRETDVIEAGGPATVQTFVDHDYDMLLFFHSRDGGMTPVIRSTNSTVEYGPEGGGPLTGQDPAGSGPVPVPAEKVVLALLSGPDEQDRAAGLGTSLPPAPPGRTLRVEPAAGGGVTAELPIALEGLGRTALRQLICTVAYSQDTAGRAVVRLTGADGGMASGTCGLDPAVRR